eukprot:TRINITY_DN197_c1_g1_i1.p2 TRINITY_DN197_c1_g1~~TRINITY_DN197_c1_g1_i1.p2  ORF type:complete len:168 (+),score=13.32 TRINITY_DN197_c1_g1_i1:89-592(+)
MRYNARCAGLHTAPDYRYILLTQRSCSGAATHTLRSHAAEHCRQLTTPLPLCMYFAVACTCHRAHTGSTLHASSHSDSDSDSALSASASLLPLSPSPPLLEPPCAAPPLAGDTAAAPSALIPTVSCNLYSSASCPPLRDGYENGRSRERRTTAQAAGRCRPGATLLC